MWDLFLACLFRYKKSVDYNFVGKEPRTRFGVFYGVYSHISGLRMAERGIYLVAYFGRGVGNVAPSLSGKSEFFPVVRQVYVYPPRHIYPCSHRLQERCSHVSHRLYAPKVDGYVKVSHGALPLVVAICPSAAHTVGECAVAGCGILLAVGRVVDDFASASHVA